MTSEFDEPQEICNYTGEICHGNPNYCEECDITEEGSEWDCRKRCTATTRRGNLKND